MNLAQNYSRKGIISALKNGRFDPMIFKKYLIGLILATLTLSLPVSAIQCFQTTYPRVLGGMSQKTEFNVMDIDSSGNVVVGGYSSDTSMINSKSTPTTPFVAYIQQGRASLYTWSKQFKSSPSSAVQAIKFNSDGSKVAIVMSDIAPMSIVFLNTNDGSLISSTTHYLAYSEKNSKAAQINSDCIQFDLNNNFYFATQTSHPLILFVKLKFSNGYYQKDFETFQDITNCAKKRRRLYNGRQLDNCQIRYYTLGKAYSLEQDTATKKFYMGGYETTLDQYTYQYIVRFNENGKAEKVYGIQMPVNNYYYQWGLHKKDIIIKKNFFPSWHIFIYMHSKQWNVTSRLLTSVH